jgi:hypothetical protein
VPSYRDWEALFVTLISLASLDGINCSRITTTIILKMQTLDGLESADGLDLKRLQFVPVAVLWC